jgi:uncharacterized protein with NAD-binding domain and iron-sulfur cluster
MTTTTSTTLSMNSIEPVDGTPNDSPEINDSGVDSLTDGILSAAADVAKDLAITALDATEKGLESIDDARQESHKHDKKKYLVIGGGWGGWGAAKALCESGLDAEIILLDALPDPTGKTPYLSKTGKPVEAGTRGFWKDYPNINKLCKDLGLSDEEVFSPFTNSSFYSPDGLEATAPVFSEAKLPKLPDIPFLSQFSEQPFPQLPSPLGQVLATSQLFERIPIQDRASMIGLLLATVDCLGGNQEVQVQYDRMTAHELFLRFGISRRLVDDFIRPTLLVGLFKPPEELSALVVMELLYYYALAHQDSFDVRWIRNGTVSDSLIAPMAEKLQSEHDLKVMGGCRVGKISLESVDGQKLSVSSVEYTTMSGKNEAIDNVGGIVLALGCKGLEAVVNASPDLAKLPVFSAAASLKGIDVISIRLWLDKVVPTRTPANVFSRFDELRGAGGTFFMLDQLQENNEALWGGEKPQGSVLGCDFYNAGGLLSLSEEDLVSILMEDLLPSAVPQFANAKVVDSWVGKFPGTVSWFAPGSFLKRPSTEGAGPVLPNVKFAGDLVRMGDREHGAKGLCQERAFVSGFEAANSLLRSASSEFNPHPVLAVREDEPLFRAAVTVNRNVMNYVPRFWVR